jgi:hypothetical protein
MSAPSGTFSIGDIPYFDGSLPGSPSSLVTSVLELMSLDVTANTNALSICPFVESDILLPKDKDTILYLVHVFLLLSGWKCSELNGKKGRNNGVPVGEKWFICGALVHRFNLGAFPPVDFLGVSFRTSHNLP